MSAVGKKLKRRVLTRDEWAALWRATRERHHVQRRADAIATVRRHAPAALRIDVLQVRVDAGYTSHGMREVLPAIARGFRVFHVPYACRIVPIEKLRARGLA